MSFVLICSILLAVSGEIFTAPTFDDQDIRIVNGTDARDGEFPFAVSLRSSSTRRHTCGGSILSPLWVLTAAHCVGNSSPKAYQVQFGTVAISANFRNVRTVAEVRRHERYNPSNQYENDIAVLRLDSPIEFTAWTGPVTLPYRMQGTPGNSPATLIGWGLDQTGGVVQQNLQKVDYFVPYHEECRRVHYYTIHDSNICGYYPGGGKGQCSGDSGGPLLVKGVQVGIVSWSIKPCAIGPYPGVLTRVSHFIDWINENTGLQF